MNVIYMHHAERNRTNTVSELKQFDDITEDGIKEASYIREKFKNRNIKAIITSPYLRCKHTAEIINEYHNAPIISDERFNELKKGEEWGSFLERNMNALNDIVNKYDDNDTIICITSGVNITAFMCYFYGVKPTNDIPWSQACNISPIIFTKGKAMLD